jgi:hypothetical protein
MMMASRRLLVAITFAEHLQDTVLFYPSQMAYLDACIDEFNGLHRFVFHSYLYIPSPLPFIDEVCGPEWP